MDSKKNTLIAELSTFFFDEKKINTILKNILLVLIGSIMIAISAKIKIHLPYTPVPVTMQTFAVLVIAIAYGRNLACATLLTYMFEGMCGLPVFASGAGLAYFTGPTAGFLIGMLVAATVVGYFAEKGFDRNYIKVFCALLLGEVIIFGMGLIWLGYFFQTASGSAGIGIDAALKAGFLPFWFADFLKIIFAALLLPSLWKIIKSIKKQT
jgi:biotin transport system substrate-specific component